MGYNEIPIKPVQNGEQNPAVEQGLKILSAGHDPQDKLMWCTDSNDKPVFISGTILHVIAPEQFSKGLSGMWMLPVHTRYQSALKER